MTDDLHRGSSFDDFLEEEGILDEAMDIAVQRFIAWQLREKMNEQGVSKAEMARRMHTSRSQVDRMLAGSKPGIGLGTLERGARALGCRLRVELA